MKQVTDKMIAELTGGRMDNYVLEGAITLVKGLTDDKALNEELEKEFDFLLESSTENNSIRAFVTKMGNKYIGDRSRAEWFVENNLVVDDEHPHQVALMVERSELDNSISNKIGYVGFSHRSSVLFVIGDKLFDEEYEYDPKDFTTEENKNFEKSLKAARRDAMENDEFDTEEECNKAITVNYVIPFTKRGSITIKTLKQAKQAALNISNYLS